MKVKVLEIEATKLDPNALYLIVFNDFLLSKTQMWDVAQQLEDFNISVVLTFAHDPENALKVYQIPKEKK